MASAYKPDSERSKASGAWYAKFKGSDGQWKYKKGFVSKIQTEELARKLESEAKLIREGLVDPRDVSARDAQRKPLRQHIEDYRLELVAKGGTAKHCDHVASTLQRLMADASIASISRLGPDRVRSALGRWVASGKSARTANHALAAARAFSRWLSEAGRLREDPLATGAMRSKYNEDADRRLVRRALPWSEVETLIRTTEQAPPVKVFGATQSKRNPKLVTGAERAVIYLVAMATGFRANEIRSLRRESFDLGADPKVTVSASYSKRRRDDEQVIRRDIADRIRPWVERIPPGELVFPNFPEKAGKRLKEDLARAGIPIRTKDGEVDFHALRHSYITMIAETADIKTTQELARHSSVTLTARYMHTDETKKRRAVEGG